MNETPRGLFVNGRRRPLPAGGTLQALLTEMGLARPGVAAAVNGEAVPAAELPARVLRDGDRVDVIQAVAGG